MTSQLRQVLNAFENAQGPVSLGQMAHDLGVELGMLESIIAYWVRKGKLRKVASSPAHCATCSTSGCHSAAKMPIFYTLASADAPPGGCIHCR
jgi:hypothetical protein